MGGIKLNPRLCAAAEFISPGAVGVDIGTDHAYLPAYLALNGKISRFTAADINEGPLLRAKETILKYGVQDKVFPVLSDGFSNIELSGVTDAVIAGMGGELICDIISNCADERLKKVNLILQPMTNADSLRGFLYENGFEITGEKAVRDRRFIYCVMRAVYSGRRESKSRLFCSTGKLLSNRDECSLEYIKRLVLKQRKKIDGIKKSDAKENLEDELSYLSKLLKAVKEYESKRNI